MNRSTKRTLIILRLVILAFLIVGTIDIISIGSWAFLGTAQRGTTITNLSDLMETKILKPRETYRYQPLTYDTALPANVIHYKRLHIDVDPGQVTVSYDVYLKRDHSLLFYAERDWNTDGAKRLTDEILGAVSVSNQPVKFEQIKTSIADTDEKAHLNVTAAPHQTFNETYEIRVHEKLRDLPLSIASKEVIVHTRGVNVRTGSSIDPVSKSEEVTRYILPPERDDLHLLIETNAATTSERRRSADSLSVLMRKDISVPGLNYVLIGLLEAIPFIIFIVWSARHGSNLPNARLQRRIVEAYLVFHFSYFFFYSLNYLIEDRRSPFVLALSYFEQQKLPVFAALNYLLETSILVPLMAMVIYAWPKLARDWTETPQQKTFYGYKRTKRTFTVFLILGLLGFVILLYINGWSIIWTNLGHLTVAEFYLLFFAVLFLILSVLVLLLAQALSLPDRTGFGLKLLLLLTLLIAADFFNKFAAGSGNKYLWHANGILRLIIFVVSATAIVWAFAVLCYRAVKDRSLLHDLKQWRWKNRLLLALALLAVALSNRYWAWPMEYWPLWALTWELKDLFLLVLMWFLANYLHKVSAEYTWLKLPPLARKAGILLALFSFYSPTTRWHYVPVSFIAGFLLLKYLLLPRRQFDRSMFSEIKTRRKTLIERVIAFNDAERALKTLKKELFTKLGKGDLTPEQYAQKLTAQVDVVEARRRELRVRKRFAKDYVLALGTGNSAWDNGCRTVYYGLLFSIPWSVLYLRDLVRGPVNSDSYLALDLLVNVVYFFLSWMSYGFIFGYFYPHIRGKNGIQKALVMFVTIVVPELVWTALAKPMDPANWVSFGFWTLQIFVHTMLLGMVAGDHSIMRSHGFKWGHLFDFYRMSSLSAWASSVILAVAAAVSTLITSEATQILKLAFKYVGVIPEDLDLPSGKNP